MTFTCLLRATNIRLGDSPIEVEPEMNRTDTTGIIGIQNNITILWTASKSDANQWIEKILGIECERNSSTNRCIWYVIE
jgi:hypothetical protein